MTRGKFITFEGLDAAGKTTQIKMAAARLQKQGYPVTLLREPGGTPLSEAIRSLLLDPCYEGMNSLTEALLYTGARSQLVAKVILPALEAGNIVLCDRFVDSTIAYQGYGRGLDLGFLSLINRVVMQGLGNFLTIFFDLHPRQAWREAGEDRLEREGLAFRLQVYEGYCRMAEEAPGRIKKVNALGTSEEVHKRVWAYLEAFLTGEELGASF